MLKDRIVAAIGRDNYVRHVMGLTNLYRAFRPFRHPGARLMRRALIPRGGVVLDIGANIGRFTALAARAVGRSGRVYSFEPVPMVLRALHTMVRLRRLGQVTIVEIALGDRNGTATINIPLKDGWKPLVPIAHLSAAAEPSTLSLSIAVERLDDLCEARGIQHVDFIKCDTEGGEFAAFSGALNCLARDLPTVVCEISQEYLARQEVEPSAVFGIFTLLGYQCFLIDPDGTLTPVRGYDSPGDYLFVHPGTLSVEKLRGFIRQRAGSSISA